MGMVVIPDRSRNDALEYLVQIQFPLERRYRMLVPSLSNPNPSSRDEEYLEQASAYREALNELPDAEIFDRAKAAGKAEADKAIAKRNAEEARQSFNLPNAQANISHWSRMSVWTIDQAVALSLGREPRLVNWDSIQNYVEVSAFAAAYQARRDIILSAKLAGQLYETNIPGFFIAWAARMNIDLPAPLVDAVNGLGIQIADWKTAYDRQKQVAEAAEAKALAAQEENIKLLADQTAYIKEMRADFGRLLNAQQLRIAHLEKALEQNMETAKQPLAVETRPVEKTFGSRERESLLKLVIGMALKGYGYNPKTSKSTVASEIVSDLQLAGVALDADTVRKYLHEARELLPPTETE
jgi:hypothetical protein